MDIRGFFGGGPKKTVAIETAITQKVQVKEANEIKSISDQKKNVNTISKSPQVVNHVSSPPNLKQNRNNKESKKRNSLGDDDDEDDDVKGGLIDSDEDCANKPVRQRLKIKSNIEKVETKKVNVEQKNEKKIVLKERESPLKKKEIIVIDNDNDNDVNSNGKVELKPEISIKTVLKHMNSKIASVEKNIEKIVSKSSFFGCASETSPLDEINSKTNSNITLKPSPKKVDNDIKFEITRDPEQISKDSIKSNLCLEGLKFGATGLMDICGREVIEDMVLRHGGKLMTSMSGKTDYLIIGSILEDKRPVTEGSKYRTAKEKDVKMITEQGFLDLISKRSENPSSSSTVNIKKSNTVSSSISKPITNPSQTSSAQQLIDDRNNSMWVDRYKPQGLNEVIGSTETVNKLSQWLAKWDDVHIKKTLKIPFSKENPGSKAVLLSGPPGIGKTTVATLVAKSFGFELLELNASDSRSKKSIHEQLSDVVLTRALCSDGSMKKRLVIMDEVDGMGGSDRGGIPELIKVIKLSKSPIICICNDRQSQKIRSLANNCFDLRVKRPTKQQIAKRLIEVAGSEGLTVEQNAAEILVEQCGNDIRQALHCLQMWNAQSTVMRYSDIKDGIKRIEKDKVLRQSPFDAVLQILAGKRTDLQERYNCFFIDYSLIPLMVQENYIHSARAGDLRNMDEATALETLSAAADAVSDMELAGASLRGQDQHWELLPTQGMLSIRVGSIINGFQAFPNFPSWLGKNSTTSKKNRLTQELVHHTSLAIGQGFTSIRLEYIPYLRNILLKPILLKGSEGVHETIEILESYGLSKDDFSENMKDLQFIVEKDNILKDNFATIDTQTKTALTKLYNQMDHRAQALVQEQSTKKKRRVNLEDDELGTIEDLDAAKADVESDDDVGDISMFAKKKRAAKNSAASKKATKAKK